MKICVESYGCAANFADGEVMQGLLNEEKRSLVKSADAADVVIINSCTVKDRSEWDFRRRIRDLKAAGKRVVVAGCIPTAGSAGDLTEHLPSIGTGNISAIGKAVDSAIAGGAEKFIDAPGAAEPTLPRIRQNPVIEIVSINQGCKASCSFCQTKLARGDLVSFLPRDIREQIKRAVDEGVKEIWLTSQDTAVYGFDIGTNVARLLESIVELEGDFMVRLGMGLPNFFRRFLDDLVRVFESPKVYKFAHIPLQSGSPKVLAAMKRPHSVKDVFSVVETLRESHPTITIATDIIAGFPGESDEDFNMTLEEMRRLNPSVVNRSKFSARPGTSAAGMKQLPRDTINKRSRAVNDLTEELSERHNSQWVGWEGDVLVDIKKRRGSVIARNYAYKPIILSDVEQGDDGEERPLEQGASRKVKINSHTTYHLNGEIVSTSPAEK